jgi:hypothetical protein
VEEGISPTNFFLCHLEHKFTEAGTWEAKLAVPSGGPQAEADGVVSFDPRYPEATALKVVYKNEAESKTVTPPCSGSVNEPVAEHGNLCVYRGEQKGSEAVEDKNIKEPGAAVAPEGAFAAPKGEFIVNKGSCVTAADNCQTGILVIFRSAQFAEPTPVTVAAATSLNARGSWTVTAN